MKVNVVMLTKDRPKLTSQALRTLKKNTPPELYNLTVIDDGGPGPLPPVWNGNAVFLHIRAQDTKGITAMARNLGVYWAEQYWGRGDYLYLTDNDMYFTPGWLSNTIGALESVTVAPPPRQWTVVGAWNHPYHQTTRAHNGPKMAVAEHVAVAGASQLMRWETWDKYGPLVHGAPGVCQSEDTIFCQRIIKDGGLIGSVRPHVAFNCGIVNTFGVNCPGADLILQELLTAKKIYPDLIWE